MRGVLIEDQVTFGYFAGVHEHRGIVQHQNAILIDSELDRLAFVNAFLSDNASGFGGQFKHHVLVLLFDLAIDHQHLTAITFGAASHGDVDVFIHTGQFEGSEWTLYHILIPVSGFDTEDMRWLWPEEVR